MGAVATELTSHGAPGRPPRRRTAGVAYRQAGRDEEVLAGPGSYPGHIAAAGELGRTTSQGPAARST